MTTPFNPQPLPWFLQLSVGTDILTTIPPQYVISFNQTRTILDKGNSFQLSLMYSGGSELEDAIAGTGFGNSTTGNVFFRYGIVGGASTGVYQGSFYGYTPDFMGGATELTISGVTNAIIKNSTAYTASYSNLTIDAIVKKIALHNGWEIGYIEPCQPLLTEYDDFTGNPTHKKFIQPNINPLLFIIEELIPYAISSVNGMGGYTVYIDDTGKRPKIHFCPPQFTQPPVARYSFYDGGGGNIISWQPNIMDANNLLQGGGTVGVASVDSISNSLKSYYKSNISTNTLPLLGSKSFSNKDMATTFLNTSSMTLQEMKSKANSLWTKNLNLSYSATMQIPGDPTLKPNTTVDILIMDPSGKPHYTTGTYFVMSIEDTLDGTGYYSNVTLMKNAIGKGSTSIHGREVTKPKSTKK